MSSDLSLVDALREVGVEMYLDDRGGLRSRGRVHDREIAEWIRVHRGLIRSELLARGKR